MSTTHVMPVVVTDSTGAILAKIEEKKRIAKADYGKYLRLKMPVMKQDSHAAIDSGELSTKVKTRETTCAALNEQVQCLITERDEAKDSVKILTNRMDEQLKVQEVRELEHNTKYNLMMACNKWLIKNSSACIDSKAMEDAIFAESDEVLRKALMEMYTAL